jgi:hypothetical protein
VPTNTPSLAAIPGLQVQAGNTPIYQADGTTPAAVDGQFAGHWNTVGAPAIGFNMVGFPTAWLPYYDTAGPNSLAGVRFNGGASGQTQWMEAPYGGNDADFFAAAIVQLDGSQPLGARLIERAGTSTGMSLVVDATGKVITFYLLGTGYFASNLTLPDNAPHLVWVARSGSTVMMGYDGEAGGNVVTFTAVATALSGSPSVWIGGKFNGTDADSLLAGKVYSFVWVSAYPAADDRRRIYDWNHNISLLTFTGLPGVPSGAPIFRRGSSARPGSRGGGGRAVGGL